MSMSSRKITGVVILAIGLFIIWATLDDETATDIWSLIWGVGWGVLISGAGVYIFFNEKEDDIEKIKNNKK